jgi:hypothetical protein
MHAMHLDARIIGGRRRSRFCRSRFCRSPKALLRPEVQMNHGSWIRRCCGQSGTKAPRVEVKAVMKVRYWHKTEELQFCHTRWSGTPERSKLGRTARPTSQAKPFSDLSCLKTSTGSRAGSDKSLHRSPSCLHLAQSGPPRKHARCRQLTHTRHLCWRFAFRFGNL